MADKNKTENLADILEKETERIFSDKAFFNEVKEKVSPEEKKILTIVFNYVNHIQEKLNKHNIGENMKNAADEYAYKMSKYMKEALNKANPKSDTPPSTYQIADYFNDILEVKTRGGKKFKSGTVHNLLKRQKELGLLKPEDFKNVHS